MDCTHLLFSRVHAIGENSNILPQLLSHLQCVSPIIYRFVCKQYHVVVSISDHHLILYTTRVFRRGWATWRDEVTRLKAFIKVIEKAIFQGCQFYYLMIADDCSLLRLQSIKQFYSCMLY